MKLDHVAADDVDMLVRKAQVYRFGATADLPRSRFPYLPGHLPPLRHDRRLAGTSSQRRPP
jgi:hypothetical protein